MTAQVDANPDLKVGSLVAGMLAGADSIDDLDLLRCGAIRTPSAGSAAPSTLLGSCLPAFDHGNVRQLAAVHRRLLARLAEQTPLLPGADTLAFVDVDSVQRRVFGATKQGAAFGHATIASKSPLVRGLNALVATVSTPRTRPHHLAAAPGLAQANGLARRLPRHPPSATGPGCLTRPTRDTEVDTPDDRPAGPAHPQTGNPTEDQLLARR